MYSYLALRKPMNGPTGVLLGSRILDTPLERDKHVLVDVCTKTGSTERIVVTKGKMKEESEKYRAIRKGEWGGIIPE